MLIENLRHHHLEDVCLTQSVAYEKEFHERKDAFAAKLQTVGSGCFAAMIDGEFAAYVFSHPAVEESLPPKLNCTAAELGSPRDANCYFLHDCCVHPRFRSRGLAKKLVREVFRVARENRFRHIYLVAVQGSVPFWSSVGFSVVTDCDHDRIACYGSDARLMRAELIY